MNSINESTYFNEDGPCSRIRTDLSRSRDALPTELFFDMAGFSGIEPPATVFQTVANPSQLEPVV